MTPAYWIAVAFIALSAIGCIKDNLWVSVGGIIAAAICLK